MSFLKAGREIQKFVLDYTKEKPEEGLMAVLAARNFNTNITETDLKFSEGKKRQLKISYYGPRCEDTGTGSESICEPGQKIAPKQMYFGISQVTASQVYQLDKDDIRLVDGEYSFTQHAMAQIRSVLPTARGKLASDVADLIYANAGLTPEGHASRQLPFVDKTNGTVNPMGMWEIERAYRDTGYSNPFIVGGTPVWDWIKATGVGAVNQNGQNIAQMSRTNLYYDTRINDAAGDTSKEHIVSFDPQMLKFVSFNKNAGIFATDIKSLDLEKIYQTGGTDYIDGVIVDPMTGLAWDLKVKYNDCDEYWTFQWKLEWDIFFLPPSVCNRQGVNGIFLWTGCPVPVYTCPDDTSPLVPTEEAEFTASASGLTFPLIVQRLNIGGIDNYPNTTAANLAALVALMNDQAVGITFAADGTDITYDGYAGISVIVNSTTLTFTS